MAAASFPGSVGAWRNNMPETCYKHIAIGEVACLAANIINQNKTFTYAAEVNVF